MIAVSIRAETRDECIREIELVKDVDFIEVRGDYIQSLNDLNKLTKYSERLIVTIRRKAENGQFEGAEEERLMLFKEFFRIKPRFVDIEFNSSIRARIIELARMNNSGVIVSYHDFEKTPSLGELLKIGNKMIRTNADMIKVVTYANKIDDNLTILKFIESLKYPVIAFCMGELGKLSRIFSPFFGSVLTYASTAKGKETAPGQLTVDEIKTIWRFIHDKWED